MARRELLLGDWNRVVRDPLDVARGCFAVAAVAFAAVEHAHVVNLAFSSAAVLAVRFVNLPRLYDLAFIGGMTLTGWGDALGLYDRFSSYDNVVHFLVPLAIAPVVYILLARGEVLPRLHDTNERHHHVGIFLVTLALGLAIGALWEIFEWCSDHALGSQLQHGQTDTITDLVADGSGALFGGFLLVFWSARRWGSERRVAGPS